MESTRGDGTTVLLIGAAFVMLVGLGGSFLADRVRQNESIEQLHQELAQAREATSQCQSEFRGFKEGRR